MRTELSLKTVCDFENTTFPLHLIENVLTRSVGDIFTEDDDAWVSFHLLFHARIQ